MQDGHKASMDSYMASNGLCVHSHLDYSQKPPLGGRPNTKPVGDHGSPNVSQPLVYSILSCVRIRMNKNSLK